MADAILNNSGVYEIVNTSNGDRYIGSAVNLRKRWHVHRYKLKNDIHHSRHLQHAFDKYGAEVFQFKPLLICDKAQLVLYEQLVLNAFSPKYNILPTAGSSIGWKPTVETREKIRAKAIGRKWTDEAKAKLSATTKGRKRPEESIRMMGNKYAVGLKHTEEWKRQNSLRMTGVPRPRSAEHAEKIAAKLRGVKHSPERRAKQAAAQVGLKRKPYKLKARTVTT